MLQSRLFQISLVVLALAFNVSRGAAQSWQVVFGPFGEDVEAITSDKFGHVYAGTDSGVVVTSNNGATWDRVIDGLAELEIFSLIATRTGAVLAGTEGEGLFRTTNAGLLWQEVNNGIADTSNILSASTDRLGTVYAGTAVQGVYVSIDDGQNWQRRVEGLSNQAIWSMTTGLNSDIYAGTTGYISRSTDFGAHWLAVDTLDRLEEVTGLAVDSNDNVFAGTHKGNLFKSIDHGANWTSLNLGTVTGPIRSIATRGNEVYVGTYGHGVFRSTDDGGSWSPFNDSIHDLLIYSLTITPGGSMFAGTYKAEVSRINLAVSSVARSATSAGTRCFPNPCSDRLTLSGVSSIDAIYDVNGRKVNGIVLKSTVEAVTLNTEELVNGAYTILSHNGEGVSRTRFIKSGTAER